jgi:hypothetical protein
MVTAQLRSDFAALLCSSFGAAVLSGRGPHRVPDGKIPEWFQIRDALPPQRHGKVLKHEPRRQLTSPRQQVKWPAFALAHGITTEKWCLRARWAGETARRRERDLASPFGCLCCTSLG